MHGAADVKLWWHVRRLRVSQQTLVASAAGTVGLAIGWATTPRMTSPVEGGVRTAEAWRRKIMSKRPIPITERAPRILAVAVVCFTVAEYAYALPMHGPQHAGMETQAAKLVVEMAGRSRKALNATHTALHRRAEALALVSNKIISTRLDFATQARAER